MKKIVFLFVCIILIASFSSCKKDENNNNEQGDVETFIGENNRETSTIKATSEVDDNNNEQGDVETFTGENNSGTNIIKTTPEVKENDLGIYYKYLSETLIPEKGLANTSETIIKDQGEYFMGWCNTKGIVSAYIADFNSDNVEDMLVIYIDQSQTDSTFNDNGLISTLKMSIYSLNNGRPTEICEEVLSSEGGFDARFLILNIYVKTYKEDKYIYYEDINQPVEGCGKEYRVFSFDGKNLNTVLSLTDPGYTSGMAIYKNPNNINADYNLYNDGELLFEKEDSDEPPKGKYREYDEAINAELNAFGLSADFSREEYWLMNPDQYSDLICSLNSSIKINPITITSQIVDNTGLREKIDPDIKQ